MEKKKKKDNSQAIACHTGFNDEPGVEYDCHGRQNRMAAGGGPLAFL